MSEPDAVVLAKLTTALGRVDRGSVGGYEYRRHIAKTDLLPLVKVLIAEAVSAEASERAADTAHTFQIAHDAISAIEIGAGSEHYRHGRETMQADALAQIDLFSSHIRQP